jgi:hypothetical protein
MVSELVGVAGLVFVLGLVLGYCSALPRVKVTEKALQKARLRVSELEMALDSAQAKAMWKD